MDCGSVHWTGHSSYQNVSIVVFETEVSDQVLATQMTERVLQFHELNENVVLRIEARGGLRRLEVEGQPFLDPFHSGPLGEVQKKGEVEAQGCGKDRVAAEKVDLDLHRISEPAKDVDIVPAFFV